jgi:hypothetical protein
MVDYLPDGYPDLNSFQSAVHPALFFLLIMDRYWQSVEACHKKGRPNWAALCIIISG